MLQIRYKIWMDNLIHFKFLYRTAALLVRIDFYDVDGRAERMTIVGIGGGATWLCR